MHAVDNLKTSECRRLISGISMGRVAFTAQALPKILPVHCALRGDELVIASVHGADVPHPSNGDVVAFEIDGYNATTREGWCVTAVGRCRSISDPAEVAAIDALGIGPCTSVEGGQYFSIRIGLLEGRKFVHRGRIRSV